MQCTVAAAAALLALFLAPALAAQNGKKNLQGHQGETPEHHGPEVSTGSKKGFKTVWDTKTGYTATKVISKNTCIISRMDRSPSLKETLPASPQGLQGLGPRHLHHRESRFVISRHRLQHLLPYGKRIQALCKGTSSFFAYPATGSNFLEQKFSCLKVKINELPVYYCGQ